MRFQCGPNGVHSLTRSLTHSIDSGGEGSSVADARLVGLLDEYFMKSNQIAIHLRV